MNKKQLLTTVAKVAFLGFLFYFCLQFFLSRWESLQLSDRLGTLSMLWVFVAAVFTLAYYSLGLLIWTTILRNLGTKPNSYLITRAYVFSLLPKYIPGNFAAHGLRTQLATKGGVPIFVSMKSFLLEAAFALGTAALISIPGALYYYPVLLDLHSNWLVIVFAFVLIAVVATRKLKLQSTNESRLIAQHRSSTSYFNVFFLFLLLWLVSGLAHWSLANALQSYSLSHLAHLMVAVSASWAIGFVSIFAPAGLGVREAVLYFFVHNWMEQADVILFVTLSRFLMFIVEVILTAGFLLYSKVTRNGNCSA